MLFAGANPPATIQSGGTYPDAYQFHDVEDSKKVNNALALERLTLLRRLVAWLPCADNKAMRLSEKGRAVMVKKFKVNNGKYLVPFALPGDEAGRMTAEEAKYANVFIDGMKQQYSRCFVDTVKLGRKTFKAVIVEGDKALFDFATADLSAEMKRDDYDKRCIVPDKKEGTKRCPLRLPNPNFDPNSKEDEKNNPKTIKNSCEGCSFDTFDRLNYSMQSLEGLAWQNDDGEEAPFEIGAPMDYEANRYIKARDEILAFIAAKYPEKLDEFTLLLDGDNRKQVAEMLNKNKSSVYKLGKGLKKDLLDLLDSLWYIDINHRR